MADKTQAEMAAEVEGITAGMLKDMFSGGWNPKIGRWQFPDGSTGMYDNKGKENPYTGKHYYPFKPAAAPLQFPDEEADRSVESRPVQRNARGQVVTPMTDDEPPYTGEHKDNFGQGVAANRGVRPNQEPRKVVQLTKED